MIDNPMFQSIEIDQEKRDYTEETFQIGDKVIGASPSVKL